MSEDELWEKFLNGLSDKVQVGIITSQQSDAFRSFWDEANKKFPNIPRPSIFFEGIFMVWFEHFSSKGLIDWELSIESDGSFDWNYSDFDGNFEGTDGDPSHSLCENAWNHLAYYLHRTSKLNETAQAA